MSAKQRRDHKAVPLDGMCETCGRPVELVSNHVSYRHRTGPPVVGAYWRHKKPLADSTVSR